jgi:hypothetical protein
LFILDIMAVKTKFKCDQEIQWKKYGTFTATEIRIKENNMGRAYSTHEQDEKSTQKFSRSM